MCSYSDSSEILCMLDQLSDSSDTSFSVEAANFTKAMDRYQNEAKSIQSTLQAIYQQMSHSMKTPTHKRTLTRPDTTAQMVVNLQERIDRLESDRKELNDQMAKFTSLTDLSLMPSRSKSRMQASMMQFSDCSGITSDEMELLRSENIALMQQLNNEKQKNVAIQRQFTVTLNTLAQRYETFATDLLCLVDEKIGQMDKMMQNIYSISTKKQFNIPKRTKLIETSLSRSLASNDRVSDLLVTGCNDLASCVMKRFGETAIPVADLINTPTEFAKYISKVCSTHESGVRKLTEELESTKNELNEAKETITAGTMSKEVADTIARLQDMLKNVAEQMGSQHETLIAKLM